MSTYKSEFLETLDQRGFIQQISDAEALDAVFAKGPVTAYTGFDPTGASLHVGHLMQIMMLYWLQQTGNRPIALMGGGTGMVGDPSFKDEARQLLTPDVIESNIAGIKEKFKNFLTFGDGPDGAVMANNAEWLGELKYLEFLRDVGQHFSVNRMLSFESVKTRLDREQSLSFLEFNYMVLQAYDFVELNRRHGCVLQFGGSDQWGNIVNGIELGHRMLDTQLYALTSPLLTTASGQKMGKTANGAVWLNSDMLSVYDFWQYWRNTEDADVERFLKLFTVLPLDLVADIAGGDINDAKKALATEVTALVHGREAAEEAAGTARATFETRELDLSLPTTDVRRGALLNGLGVLAAAVEAGLATSNGEARRHVQSGALRLNDTVVTDDRAMITDADVLPQGVIKLSVGKKRHVLIRPV